MRNVFYFSKLSSKTLIITSVTAFILSVCTAFGKRKRYDLPDYLFITSLALVNFLFSAFLALPKTIFTFISAVGIAVEICGVLIKSLLATAVNGKSVKDNKEFLLESIEGVKEYASAEENNFLREFKMELNSSDYEKNAPDERTLYDQYERLLHILIAKNR